MIRHAISALLASASFSVVTPAAEPAFEAFLEKHCVSCHGPDEEKGDLRIDLLSRDFKSGLDTHLWAEIIENVNSGAMPPKKNRGRARRKWPLLSGSSTP